jgi:hypothetical protein
VKVYIYDDDNGTLHAMAENGDRLAVHEFDGPQRSQADIIALRDTVLGVWPKCTTYWVQDPTVHPVLARLLAEEQQTHEATLNEATGDHLCQDCAHAFVCVGRREAEAIGFTINTCEQHVALPKETEP